jgi:hypothetical protein
MRDILMIQPHIGIGQDFLNARQLNIEELIVQFQQQLPTHAQYTQRHRRIEAKPA